MSLAQAVYLVCSLIICTFPANFFIRWFMKTRNISADSGENNEYLLRAGRIIGALERILSLIFIINNNYEAVGFIIAAKTILRFRDTDTAKTEYLLIGSLLSFLIVVAIGTGYGFIK